MQAYRISETLSFLPLNDEDGDFGLIFDSSDNTVTEIHTQEDLRALFAQLSN